MGLQIFSPTVMQGNNKVFVPSSGITTVGSMSFLGNSTSNLSVANNIDFRFRTGDFTIEWFQYMTSAGSFPRIFAMGNYPSQSIGVSIEGGIFYFWTSGANSFGSVSSGLINTWNHFAISRAGTSLRVFRNGNQLGSTSSNATDFNDTTNNLRIGNETSATVGAAYQGYITNFRWVKGTAVYTSSFPTPTSTLQPIDNTKLLLAVTSEVGVSTDSSANPKTVINSSVAYIGVKPFA